MQGIVQFIVLAIIFSWGVFTFNNVSSGPSVADGCVASGCHEKLMDKSTVHEAATDDCETCHESNGNEHPDSQGDEFKLAEAVPDLCFQCHDGPEKGNTLHSPFEEGDCLTCHSPHSSNTPKLLLAKTPGDLCNTCHDVDDEEKSSRHPPMRRGKCVECHDPHQSAQPSLLKVGIPYLCFVCHKDIEKQEKEKSVHPPFEEECMECHEPHVSDQSWLLQESVPDLCYTCHEDMKEELASSPVVHPAITERKSCLGCHLPHSSSHETLLRKKERALCYQCHSDSRRSPDKIRVNIREKVENSKYVHPPVEDGCDVCHAPHAAQFDFLLPKRFPKGNYTKPKLSSFAFCLECHDPEFLQSPETDSATEFRNGRKNLHVVHVMKEKAMVCVDCHDVHGSDNEHLIAKKIRFGKWEMPLHYQTTESGGSCRPACHEEKTYRR
ncbi:MAG: hypothetical protein GXO82_09600 [Chlorobi bacterium]|nr:hypothetical protein [Chlorobiota bacterium]